MNKDIISEIYKYLNRDVYSVCLMEKNRGDSYYKKMYYFYSYDKAYENAKELIMEDISIVDVVNEVTDWVHDSLYHDDHVTYHKIMALDSNIREGKKHYYGSLVKACKKILGKSRDELIVMTGYIVKIINGEKWLHDHHTIKLEKLTIELA